ncbi:MAG: hypothetical protein HYX94_01725 [Chloroflexi bacterium]|nr:hypothetical protein [Chloroflexota bacterium]
MKLSLVLAISAVFMALIGLGYLLIPATVSFGVVDATASSGLIELLRLQASTFLGIAVLNWVARNAEASKARDSIVLANTVGFALAAILGIWGLFNGLPTVAWVPVIIDLLFAVAFFWTGKASMSAGNEA